MSRDIDDARRDLMALPPSERRAEALRLLHELERSEEDNRRGAAELERKLAALAPSQREVLVWRFVPWLTAALGAYAIYCGVDALITEELCSRIRWRSIACSYGRSAQVQGAVIVSIGFVILLITLRSSTWRTVIFCILGISCVSLYVAYLVTRA